MRLALLLLVALLAACGGGEPDPDDAPDVHRAPPACERPGVCQ